MATDSYIAPETLQAYNDATYTVICDDDIRINFRIGQSNPCLKALLAERGAHHACFVTAYNPRSEALAEEENQARQKELVRYCEEQCIAYLKGYSQDCESSGLWLEQSLLLLCDSESGKNVGTMFEQNSIVCISGDGLPSLANLR